jgi:hypothetical protein
MSHSVDWQLYIVFSGQPISPIFNCQAVQEDLNCLTFEDASDMLSRNVSNYQSTLRNIPEESRPIHYLLRVGL